MPSKTNIDLIKKLIVDRLKSIHPSKIILFGSYAYGNPSDNSDLDICIVKKEVLSKIKEKREIRKRLKDILIAKDILVPSEKEFDFYKTQYGSVFMDINQKGIVLWPDS